jgi:hypothetical protein
MLGHMKRLTYLGGGGGQNISDADNCDMMSRLEEATGTESKVQEVSNQLGNGLTLDAEHSSEAQVASKATAPQVKAGGSWAKIASAPKSEEDVAVE